MKKIIFTLLMFTMFGAMAQDIKVNSRMSFYTDEPTAEVMVYIPENTKFAKADAAFDGKTVALKAGLNMLAVPTSKLKNGENQMSVKVTIDGKTTDYNAVISKLAPKDNAVKIDYATGGFIVDGLPFIPYGFYTSLDKWLPNLIEEEVLNGFNMLSPYHGQDANEQTKIGYLDRAAEVGMKANYNMLGMARYNSGISIEEQLAAIKKEVDMVKDHPALLSYYIADEPDGQDVPPAFLETIYKAMKEYDPYHPVSIVIVSAPPARNYASTHDIVMTDPYVVPNTHAKNASQTVRDIYNEMKYEKAIWLVAQTFGGNEWWTREPTYQEMRMMCYAAALYNCTGYQAFIRNGRSSRPKSQVLWNEYSKAGMEIQELTPYLLGGRTSVAESGDKDIISRTYHLDGKAMVVAVNEENEFKTLNLKTAFGSMTGQVYMPFENRYVDIKNGVITDIIEPFGTKVYSVEEVKSVSKIDPSNLSVDASFEFCPSTGVPTSTYAIEAEDPASNYFVDSRIAYDGEHSLRLTNPKNAAGTEITFYPIQLLMNRTYSISVWAKTDKMSLAKGPVKFKIALGNFASKEFELTDKWAKYTATGKLEAAQNRYGGLTNGSLQMMSAGKGWFDLVEITPDIYISMDYAASGKEIITTLTNNQSRGEIRYTLDGSVPTAKSTLYTAPFTVSKVCTVKAQIFDGKDVGGVVEEFLPANKALNAKVVYNIQADITPAGGDMALVDGYSGKLEFNHPRWQRWDTKDMDVTVDLGSPTDIKRLTTYFFHSSGDHVVPPTKVEYLVSNDGVNFKSVGIIDLGIAENMNAGKARIPAVKDKVNTKARYVRVVAKNHGIMPDWFLAAGKAWIYADEIIVE